MTLRFKVICALGLRELIITLLGFIYLSSKFGARGDSPHDDLENKELKDTSTRYKIQSHGPLGHCLHLSPISHSSSTN